MSKLYLRNRIPAQYNRQAWHDILKDIENQVNSLSESRITANYGAQTTKPTTGTYQLGDFVKNSNTVENGTSPNRYVVLGWICVAAGTPGTWQECRFYVGNDLISLEKGGVVFTGYAPTVT